MNAKSVITSVVFYCIHVTVLMDFKRTLPLYIPATGAVMPQHYCGVIGVFRICLEFFFSLCSLFRSNRYLTSDSNSRLF